MLKAAGVGIAMGNSDAACRQAADYVTARIEEDGLYQACVHYGWIRP
jgi:hydroxymethylpyrimidine pyrophosphatase-like HAD family hydrolase